MAGAYVICQGMLSKERCHAGPIGTRDGKPPVSTFNTLSTPSVNDVWRKAVPIPQVWTIQDWALAQDLTQPTGQASLAFGCFESFHLKNEMNRHVFTAIGKVSKSLHL